MSAHRLAFVLALLSALLLSDTFAVQGPDLKKEAALTAKDKKFLDGLMKEFLFDPKGAERVSVTIEVRTVWARSSPSPAEGWLVAGKGGKPGLVYFTDGASVPAPPEKKMRKVDFRATCKGRYAAAPKKEGAEGQDIDEAFRKMRQTAVGALGDNDLALAAWLYRLGEEGLAAQALAAARKGEGDARKLLRAELAWSAFAGMVHAYMVRADEEVLAHGERLLRLYPDEVNNKQSSEYRQAAEIVKDLKRRQKKGTFGKAPPEKWPDGFAKWDVKKKATYLIDALEEVDARQWGQPGGVDLASDRRVEGLIRLGDAAIPALLEALEDGERLTRSVHFWRDFARSRTVLGVREAVLTALMSILRVRVFEPAATGDNFTARGEDAAKEMARRLRAYWKRYGHLPFDERMMKVLTDPKTTFEAKREAAGNLASLDEGRHLATTIQPTIIGLDRPRKPNPAVAKFSKPTVAEAILSAMDADLKAHDAKPAKTDPGYRAYERRGIEGTYLSALVELGDRRVAPELAKRAANAKAPQARRRWAQAAHDLGDPKPFRSFTEDFGAGKVEVRGGGELGAVLDALMRVGTPEAGRALGALADPKHPQYKALAKQVLGQTTRGFDRGPWFAHPFCLSILRRAIDDTSRTGATYAIEKGTLWRKLKDGSSGGPVPAPLANPTFRRDEAAERACDVAAEKLGELVIGLPPYHPLFKDADKRLTALKAAFDRFAGNHRRATWREQNSLGLSPWAPAYLPDVRPLGRAATAKDVKAGKAIFHLPGKGKPAGLALPAVAVLKRDENKEGPPRVLVVQAEVEADGQVTYGIITRESVRAVPGRELTGIRTFAELDREEREAAEKEKGKKD